MGLTVAEDPFRLTMSPTPPQVFDRPLYRRRRIRAERANGDLFLVAAAAEQLAERLAAINRRFGVGLDLGTRAAVFPALADRAGHWTRAGYSPEQADVVADEEALPFAAESFDLVTSVLSLHAVNDLPGAILQIRRALKPDGLFLAALFGGETLTELRQSFAAAESEISGGLSPRVAPFGEVRALGGLLQRAGLALPVADVERTVVRYRDLSQLFRDLAAMGETNALTARRRTPLSPRVMAAAARHYAERFSDPDGRFRATFDIVHLAGWAPHESQQQPLRPGSAKGRLADALGTREIPTGEKPG
jgi:SAM-dependent methyltransferase